MPSSISVQLPTRQSPDSLIQNTSCLVCQICKVKPQQYTCPRCSIPYCSSTCFRDQKHAQCSEPFYQKQVVDALNLREKKEDEMDKMDTKLQMMRILERSGGKLDIVNRVENDEEEDSEEGSEDDTQQNSLAQRFKDLDVESMDTSALESQLTREELRAFQKQMTSTTTTIVSTMTTIPWWTNNTQPKEIEIQHTETETDTITSIPRFPRSRLNSTTYHILPLGLVNILLSYALVYRYTDGEMKESIGVLCDASEVLAGEVSSSPKNVEDAILQWRYRVLETLPAISPPLSGLLILYQDLSSLLTPPNHIQALKHLRILLTRRKKPYMIVQYYQSFFVHIDNESILERDVMMGRLREEVKKMRDELEWELMESRQKTRNRRDNDEDVVRRGAHDSRTQRLIQEL